ncbi:MAG: TIGR02449 family protein [Gammaproteobacteria bacterium]|nr:TIGR02449 family protein [Gammaproteobacteria bacterium]
MDSLDTQALEEKIDHLIRICNRLEDENRALRDQQNSLIAERAALVEKSEMARSRVEAMITRLRAMEAGT